MINIIDACVKYLPKKIMELVLISNVHITEYSCLNLLYHLGNIRISDENSC